MIQQNGKTLLEVRGLCATVNGIDILKGIDLTVRSGEVHALMGPNGSGKSTFAKALAGHPAYVVTGGTVLYEGKNLLELKPEERARAGVFLGFQYPVEIPGVANSQFLRLAYNTVQVQRGKDELDPLEFDDFVREKMKLLEMNPDFLDRSVNEGFSGGEKKRNEILQMALLEPRLAILDETDSGLDIDALRVVAGGINQLAATDNAIVLVTHYQRLLNYIVPDYVHVMDAGRIVKTGGKELALELETRGYDWVGAEHEDCREGDRMSATRTLAAGYLESLLAGQPRLPASPLAWLNELRAEAVDRVGVLTVPTIRDEEWRFTDLSPLTKLSFQPVRMPVGLKAADVERFRIEEATTRLVFVDGIHAPELSSVARDGGVVVANLSAAGAAHAAAIDLHLGRHVEFRDSVFAALNTAFLHDGALVVVPRDVSAAAPVHLLFIATQKGAASYPRCLLVAESGSAVTVVEDYVALQPETYFTNAVTEIALGDSRACRPHPGTARQRPGVSYRELRRVTRECEPLSVGQRRAWCADLPVRPECAPYGRRRRVHDRRARADRGAPARRHPYLHRPREAARRQPPAAQMHRWRCRARGVQRQDHRAPGRPAHQLFAVEPQPAADRRKRTSTPSRSSRFSPTTSSARMAPPSASSTARRCSI